MLETIREYGRERLERSGELESTRRAHSAYCLVLAEEGAANMAPAQRDGWLSRCDAEHDNFRAAIEYLIESGKAEWGLRLGSALFWFWEAREHLTEGRRSLASLLGAPGANLLKAQYAPALYAAGVLADAQLDFDSAEASSERESRNSARTWGQAGDCDPGERFWGSSRVRRDASLKPGRMSSDRCCSGRSSAPASSFSA